MLIVGFLKTKFLYFSIALICCSLIKVASIPMFLNFLGIEEFKSLLKILLLVNIIPHLILLVILIKQKNTQEEIVDIVL
jgi:hypothetical protein